MIFVIKNIFSESFGRAYFRYNNPIHSDKGPRGWQYFVRPSHCIFLYRDTSSPPEPLVTTLRNKFTDSMPFWSSSIPMRFQILFTQGYVGRTLEGKIFYINCKVIVRITFIPWMKLNNLEKTEEFLLTIRLHI